jgi:FKBP-type peptidyl-prolyl cis-trans isomerase FkpA
MIRILKKSVLLISTILFITSCSNDDNNVNTIIDLEPVLDQYILENDSIVTYMKTHFYNYEDFQNLASNSSVDLVIDTIAGDNSNKVSIFDQITTFTVDIVDENDEIVPHNMYYIINREGNGQNPSVADSVFVSYKGFRPYSDDVFDSKPFPVWLDNVFNIRGFKEFTSFLKRGDVIINNDGTYDFENFGIGFVIMPSKLGYYDNSTSKIPAYSPLIFQVNLHTLNVTDHDLDTINSIEEDLNRDNDLFNDDTDEDGIPNFQDIDDDNDGILTKDEYDQNGDNVPDDSDNDGIPDYLDSDN